MGAHAQLLGMRSPQPLQSWLVAEVARRQPDARRMLPWRRGYSELRPARIADAFGKAAVPYQVGDLQVFQVDRIVGLEQRRAVLW